MLVEHNLRIALHHHALAKRTQHKIFDHNRSKTHACSTRMMAQELLSEQVAGADLDLTLAFASLLHSLHCLAEQLILNKFLQVYIFNR